jgi:tetratricopeptide (TPR) repeat protein
MKNRYLKQLLISASSLSLGVVVHAQAGLQAEVQGRVAEDQTPAILDILPSVPDEDEEIANREALLRRTVALYAERVIQLEAENGAYNNELEEELASLGQAFYGLGEFQQALDVYTRALHINRINQGLHNINQLPILELIIKANTELNNFEELDKNFSYLLWIINRNYDANDIQRVPAYLRAANWHMDAYDITTPPESIQHLIIAANYFSKATDVIESAKGPDDPELINSLYGIVNANFKLVEPYGFIADIDSFISGKLNPLLPSNFDSDFDSEEYSRNAYRALDYSQDHLSRIVQDEKYTFSLVQNSYKSGRNALLRIINIHEKNPDLPPLSYAYALTHTGDWYLRFYKRRFAMGYYQQAYQILSANEYGDQAIYNLFGRPRSLGTFEEQPEFEFERVKIISSIDITDEAEKLEIRLNDEILNDKKFVLAQFRVTKYGAVRNLEILAANPADNVRFRRMARNTINSTPFRPRMENGQPIVTDNVKILYRFQ